MNQKLPEGVVTFLFTDLEGSTRMFEEAPDLMMEALHQHDEAIEEVVTDHSGIPVRPRGEGDSRFIVFSNAHKAVAGAAAVQRRLACIDWPTPKPLRIRASLHTGIADLRSGDYYGSAVNRAARLRGIAHGGQTLMSRSTWELVQDELPNGVQVVDLGQHSLKDLTRPEGVFQLTPVGLPDEFPPLSSLNYVPNNLPEQVTDFVGRQSELADAQRLINETRLLTILAPGGTGKTRLGIQTAAEVSTEYADGVFFIGFADISSNEDIIQTMAESLGVSLSGDGDIQAQLLTYLAPRQQLLVLDNLEHLDDAAGIINEVLRAAPQVKIVATSRNKLNLTGESVLFLTGLDINWQFPEEAMQTSGVQLFIETAKRAYPDFVLEPNDLDTMSEILSLVDGMPLGILLSAAWVDMLSIQEIAAEIRKSVDFLETEMRDVPDRQRSIRAVFDSSWSLLTSREQETFTALSVFRGGFSREAAEVVANASLRSLASLVSKSLITSDPETGRYQVHELLRQYAAAELKQDSARYQEIQNAHITFYTNLMGEAPFMMSHGQQADMLDMIERDIENIRSAWRHQIRIGDAVAARKFLLGFFLVYEFRGWYPAAVSLFDEALDLLPQDSDDEDIHILRALISAVKGWSLTMLSQPQAGVLAAAEPTEYLARSGELLDYWIAVQCLALGLAYLGSINEMRERLDEAISRHNEIEDQFWVASLKDWRSFAAVLEGDLDAGTKFAGEAMDVVRSSEEYWVTTWNLWVRAMIAIQEQRLEDAIGLYTEHVAMCRKVSFVRGIMVSMDELGKANLGAGRLEAAERAFTEGISAARQMGLVREVLSMMTKVAKVRALQGQRIEAVELLATVLLEPASAHSPFTDPTPINETATTLLSELEGELDPEEYASAHARGMDCPYDVVAKQLLEDIANDLPPKN
jgi:predicted ATPase/class 3 adenylate cyclase